MLSISNSPVQLNNTICKNKSQYSYVNFCGGVPYDTLTISRINREKMVEKILNKLRNFSIDEYKNMTQNEIKTLRNEYDNLVNEYNDNYLKDITYSGDVMSFKELEGVHDKAANYIKKKLDEKYGKGNYTVILPGRSLSSIGKTLGYKIGEENVVNFPLSASWRFLDQNDINNVLEKDNYEFINFLKKHNLNKDSIKNSDKKYVIMDYCISGKSLKGAEKLLKNDELLGTKNVSTLDLRDCIPNSEYWSNFEDTLNHSRFKSLSFVNKSYDLTDSVVDTTESDLKTRLIWFKLLDNQMQEILATNQDKPNNISNCYHKQVDKFITLAKRMLNLQNAL